MVDIFKYIMVYRHTYCTLIVFTCFLCTFKVYTTIYIIVWSKVYLPIFEGSQRYEQLVNSKGGMKQIAL